MKIALLARKYDPFGGAELYISRLTDALLDEGHCVSILAGEWGGESESSRFHPELLSSPPLIGGDLTPKSGYFFGAPLGKGDSCPSYKKISIPMVQWDSITAVGSFAWLSGRKVQQLRRATEVDLVHSFERTLHQDVVRIGHGCHREWLHRRSELSGHLKSSFLWASPLHQLILSLEKRQLEGDETKVIIANSQRGREEILEHYKIAPEKIAVIYNGVDRAQFFPAPEKKRELRHRWSLPEDRPILLFVGSGFYRKGLEFAIRALPFLRVSPLLLVIGRGKKEPYQKLAEQIGVQGQLAFVEPSQEMAQWYQLADLFLLPSIYEPFSNACLEAMSSGLPLVIPRDTGIAEVIREGVNGVLLEDITDSPAMASALERALTLDRSLGRVNDEILRALTWEANLQKTLEVYRRVMDEKKNVSN